MSEETKTVSASQSAANVMGDFDEMLYWVSVARSDFDIAKFRRRLPSGVSHLDDSAVSVDSRDDASKYHVFFAWNIADDQVEFNIEFHSGPWRQATDEREPFAEDFMPWFGQFFSASTVECHVHARIKYPLEQRQSTFPMALTTEPPCAAELYGVSLRLPSAPNGVSSVRITRGRSHWYTEVVADSQITFGDFSPFVDAKLSTVVLGMFLRECAT